MRRMKVENRPDHPYTDDACREATGKTISQWYAEFDSMDALKLGRREIVNKIYVAHKDIWWATTLFVEYEKAKGVTKKDGLFEGYTICVTKSIGAPVSKTYGVWTDQKHFAKMFGDGATQTVAEGGSIQCAGGCQGQFSRVRADKDLRFSWTHPGCTAPMIVDVQFQDNNGKTLVNVMTSRIQTRPEADGLRNSWSEALTRLKAMSEA
jgi:uncharacterized protein YndB with AHSA1/START domain